MIEHPPADLCSSWDLALATASTSTGALSLLSDSLRASRLGRRFGVRRG